jgi:hypothetical protein
MIGRVKLVLYENSQPLNFIKYVNEICNTSRLLKEMSTSK